MLNTEIADVLNMTAKLMELHGENAFKARSYQSASFRIDKLIEPLQDKSIEELEATEGIGQSLSKKIHLLTSTGTFPELEALYKKTPAGVLEMMQIKGIGPKKVAVLWKELGVESTGELLYACNENRLLALKGFGEKTQQQIIQSIEFINASKGQFLYPDTEADATEILELIQSVRSVHQVAVAGEFRRRCEIITQLEFLVAPVDCMDEVLNQILQNGLSAQKLEEESKKFIKGNTETGISVVIRFGEPENFIQDLLVATGSQMHHARMREFNPELDSILADAKSEEDIYKKSGLQFVIPEMREGEHKLTAISEKTSPGLIELEQLQGIVHNHSTWSDGANSILEMAEGCKALNKTYFGICDHSRSAVYAGGLTIERVAQQHLEIDQLNKQISPFRIFKGIESDILSDGSLDYPDEVLATFDFVVASIHQGFKMDQQKATDRLIRAIQNPFTTIIGHCTGRLLLSRPGYPVDHKAMIDACAEANVIIELNANPHRLDMDWRWIDYALSRNVMISINPDAHSVKGLKDINYGVNAARKGGLTTEMTFNARSLEFVENWFLQKRKKASKAER